MTMFDILWEHVSTIVIAMYVESFNTPNAVGDKDHMRVRVPTFKIKHL